MKGDEIFRAFDHHSIETVTLGKYVAEYAQMRKWIVEISQQSSRSWARGIKMTELIWVIVAQPLFFFDIFDMVSKWRHHELSFSLRWAWIYLSLVYIYLGCWGPLGTHTDAINWCVDRQLPNIAYMQTFYDAHPGIWW